MREIVGRRFRQTRLRMSARSGLAAALQIGANGGDVFTAARRCREIRHRERELVRPTPDTSTRRNFSQHIAQPGPSGD
jgi:hypothetical protein